MINGNLKRHSGLLYNEAYIGFLIFNRIAMIKNPETGKRISRPNPPEKWQVVAAPHLRIVPDEVWDDVQARKKIYGGQRTYERRRPRHMFSGLVRCGACGGSYTIKTSLPVRRIVRKAHATTIARSVSRNWNAGCSRGLKSVFPPQRSWLSF